MNRLFSAAALSMPVMLASSVALADGHIPGRHVDTSGRTIQDNCPKESAFSGDRTCFSHRILGFANEPVSAPQRITPHAACDPTTAGTYSTYETWMLGATQLAQLYNLAGTGTATGDPPIVAIVDAFGYSGAFADLTAYRAQFGLPVLPKCAGNVPTGATACFAQVSQTGSTTLPADDSGWDGEQALDLDMVSAGCPNCSILLVDAASAGADLDTAVEYAAGVAGVVAVSNSYGGTEAKGDKTDDTTIYSHPGVLIAAASGDQDYDNEGISTKNGDTPAGPNYPASSPNVLAVGGTTPNPDCAAARGFDEIVWSLGIQPTGNAAPADAATGTGSGCSTVFATPTWQTVTMGSCTMRGTNDVSAAADWNSEVPYIGPDGGVETNPVTGKPYHYAGIGVYQAGCWEPVGGTSAATPLVSAIFARYGFASKIAATGGFSNVYSNASYFNDVTSGNNDVSGKCTDIMCNAGTGWDGPTGMGTPIGTAIAVAMGVTVTDAGAPSMCSDDAGTSAGPNDGGISDASTLDATIPSGGDDSGAVSTPDSGVSTTPAGDSGNDVTNGSSGSSSSGCGCVVVGPDSASPLGALGSLFAFGSVLALGARRRRRG